MKVNFFIAGSHIPLDLFRQLGLLANEYILHVTQFTLPTILTFLTSVITSCVNVKRSYGTVAS